MEIGKLENFDEKSLKIEKAEMVEIKGGTSTTMVTVCGIAENEYEDIDGDGCVSDEDRFIGTFDMGM